MTVSTSRPAQEAVETIRQARAFDAMKRHYERLGLCRVCAAQASWGHQLGFSRLAKQPCHECQAIIDTFPVARPGRWRSSSPRRGAEFSSSFLPGAGQ